ncbi:hypothetical protein [Rahnella sp. CJA17(1/100)]|uniref:hypothetical protein n=1 Tax=Rahnella sp. CJA17(1/100) TaxID=2508951 RepID=UPI00106F4AFA|nr:hypothetical protein [Rahnella sp. CJA17(1/100)]
MSMNPFYTSHRIGQLILKRSALAYARLYHCPQVMLLYPHHTGLGAQPLNAGYRIREGEEQLQVASVNMLLDEDEIVGQLIHLIGINTQIGSGL